MHYIITEKGTTARRIAAILSDGRAKKTKVGGVEKVAAYEFDGKVVVGLSGHIVQLDVPKEYKTWSLTNAYKLIDSELVVVPLKKEVVKALRQIAKDADALTLATDYDREGELIGVEALNIIKKSNPALLSPRASVKIDRMRYSAITEKEIKESFAARSEVDYNLAAAAEARQITDLVWGASLTRFVSLSASFSSLFSVGRVQSPTLALLVAREREIEKFVPRKYWEVTAKLKTAKGEIFEAAHEKGKFWKKADAEAAKARIEAAGVAGVAGVAGEGAGGGAGSSGAGSGDAVVCAVKTKLRTEKPPTPFDTTAFIRAAASFGFSPKRTMTVAESLYLAGLISYHRTDNTTYPKTLDLRALVKMFLGSRVLGVGVGEHAAKIAKKRTLKPTAGKKKTTDHPPIHPVATAEAGEKKIEEGSDEWKVYELVVRRFLATLSDPAKWKDTEVKVEAGGEILKAKGKELKERGFLAVYPYLKREKEVLKLPDLKKGERVEVVGVEVVEKETKPPNRISQAGLVKKMEELGLGTKSTRHEIIGKLYDREYVQGNPAKPTGKAFALVDALEKHATLVTKPEMTKTLEQEMDEISVGKRAKEEVVADSRRILKAAFKELTANREEIAKSLREAVKIDKVVGECPKCGSALLLRRSKRGKRFLGCSNYPDCSFSLPLPNSTTGKVVVTEDKCEEHPYLFKLKIVGKGKRRAWDFGCPYCNFLQWKEKKENENTKSSE